MGLDKQKNIRASRLILTSLLLFVITWYYQVPESSWSLITVWVVLFEHMNVGGLVSKSIFRLTGTLLSALYGVAIIYCCGNDPLINIIAMIFGIFVYVYYFMGTEKAYIAMIGSLTLTLVFLNYNNVEIAIFRVLNICIGIISIMFMMRFFYPQFAKDRIIEALFNFVERNSTMIESYLDPSISLASIKENYFAEEPKILEHFIVFKRLMNEASWETKKTPLFISHNEAAFERLRHIFWLFSVFVVYVSTDEIRADPSICDKLRQLLLDMRAIGRMLEKGERLVIANTVAALPSTSSHEKMKIVEDLLENIKKETLALDIEIEKMLLIYNQYAVKNPSIIKTVEI